MNQYRAFFLVSWIYVFLQAFLVVAEAQGFSLYPPFRNTVGFIAGTCFALTWLFFVFVFHYFRQRGFIPWIIALYGLLSLVDPLIDMTRTPNAAALLRLSDGYVWFHFGYSVYRFAVIWALFSVKASPIAWRCRWITVSSVLALAAYVALPFALKDPRQAKFVAYGPLLELLPVILAAGLFRKTRRFKKRDRERAPSGTIPEGEAAMETPPHMNGPLPSGDRYL